MALLTSFTLAVFAVALAATMPAAVIARLTDLPPQVEALSGRALAGRARLSGGLTLDWRARPGAVSLAGVPVDLALAGAETRLTGTLRLRPREGALSDLAGRAGPDLLALAPGAAALSCTGRAAVAVDRLAWTGEAAEAQGEVRIEAGACAPPGREPVPIPAMRADLTTQGTDAVATLAAEAAPTSVLASARVTGERVLLLRVEPEGARLVPGMPSSAPTILELPF